MEIRIKNYLSARFKKDHPGPQAELLSVPYKEAAINPRQPIHIFQPLTKSTREESRCSTPTGGIVRSPSYETIKAGRAPKVGGSPHKGNGPIKLQASRRTETGELVISEESPDTLQELRAGEYIIHKKSRTSSYAQGFWPKDGNTTKSSPRSAITTTSPSTSTTNSYSRPPTSVSEMSNPVDAFLLRNNSSSSIQARSSAKLLSAGLDQRASDQSSHADLKRILTPSTDRDLRLEAFHGPAAEMESNPTLKALRKAEYTRLIALQGQNGLNLKVLRSPSLRSGRTASPTFQEPSPSPRLSPNISKRTSSSAVSGTSEAYLDDSSAGSSPQRASYLSSYAGSANTTAQSSVVEEEFSVAKEDIRRTIEQIRSTYITALEAQTSPPNPIKKKAAKRRKRTSKYSSVPRIDTAMAQESRWAWQIDEDEGEDLGVRFQSFHTHGQLSPIQASPTRSESQEGLHRVDSATLGNLVSNLKKDAESGPNKPNLNHSADATSSQRSFTHRRRKKSDYDFWLHTDSSTTSLDKADSSPIKIASDVTQIQDSDGHPSDGSA